MLFTATICRYLCLNISKLRNDEMASCFKKLGIDLLVFINPKRYYILVAQRIRPSTVSVQNDSLRPRQSDCDFADDIFKFIFIVWKIVQISCNSIQMGQLTIRQYWSIGPKQSLYQMQMLWRLMRGVRQQLSCFIDHTPV